MELKEVFEEIKAGRDLREILELNLEKAKCQSLAGLPDSLPELAVLNASGLGLDTLEGLPMMAKLHTLNLSENKLKGEALKVIAQKCPGVEQLNLCDNSIEALEDLMPLKEISNLLTLDLYENDVTKIPNYREEVFKLFPNMRYLDGYDANNEEIEMSGAESMGEDEMSSGAEDEGDDDEEDEDEEIGLSYLDSSKCLQDEDESPDFQEKPKDRKRKAEPAEDEPEGKQAKEE